MSGMGATATAEGDLAPADWPKLLGAGMPHAEPAMRYEVHKRDGFYHYYTYRVDRDGTVSSVKARLNASLISKE